MAHERMLIVEDSPAAARAMATIFRARGWRTTTAATLAEALAGLDDEPDCIVLDLMLPDGDGERVLEEARRRGLPCRVAVATGVSDSARLAALAAWKPEAVLRKPIDPRQVCRA